VGLLVFLASFLPWYGVTGFGVTSSYTGWHAGLSALGLILLLLATGVTAAELFARDSLPQLPFAYPLVEAGLAGVGAVLVVVKSLDLPADSALGDVALRWGGWILVLVTIGQAGITALRAVHANDGVPPAAPPL
jgi:hypothetical protein